MRHSEPSLFERLISVGSYLTLGFIGMIWFLLNAVVLKKPNGKYLIYNLIQSFILSILYAIFTYAYDIFIGLYIRIPYIGNLFLKGHIFLFETPVFNTMSFVNFILLLLMIYLSSIALFGRLPYIPFITDVTKKAFR